MVNGRVCSMYYYQNGPNIIAPIVLAQMFQVSVSFMRKSVSIMRNNKRNIWILAMFGAQPTIGWLNIFMLSVGGLLGDKLCGKIPSVMY